MHHFFLHPANIQAGKVEFPPDRSHQIARVLRLHPGDRVNILDNTGYVYLTELIKIDPSGCIGKIIGRETIQSEPDVNLHLFIAITQREKLEWIFQKCTEIGVRAFTPVLTERTLLQEVSAIPKKMERWQRIVTEAAEQSQRGLIPDIMTPVSLSECLQWREGTRLIADESEHKGSLQAVLSGAEKKIALLIGPEGGFGPQEISQARENGWLPISLGKRILRMETAAIVASALVMAYFGELGITPSDR